MDNLNVNVEFAADLTKHQKAVNSVRFSPDGQWLATGDDGELIVNRGIIQILKSIFSSTMFFCRICYCFMETEIRRS